MTLKHSFRTALTGLKTNQTRSLLTILGIVIGIGAIIVIMSLGSGAQLYILSQVQGLGAKTIVVLPGRTPTSPSDSAQLFSDSLKEQDVVALEKKSNVPKLESIMPVVFGGDTGVVGSNVYQLTLFGGSEQMASIFSIDTAEGVFISADDVRSHAAVAVIGSKVKTELFGDSNAVGQVINIHNRAFRIIGVLPQKGQSSFINFDEAAIVPYTTAQEYIFGIKYFHRIFIEPDTQQDIAQTVNDVTLTIRESHKITDPTKDDFHLETQADLANIIGSITTALTLFLVAVASIALLVGGIGIMNIMLVSVTERTREIGLRLSVGARGSAILQQFLSESVVLSTTGGLIGAICGILGAQLVASIGHWPATIPAAAVLVAIVFSAMVGIFFGWYPASRAARLDPIAALRAE